MGKINTLKLDSHPRGVSGVLRWSWVKKESDGTTRALSLVGYKAALTVKSPVYDDSTDDSTAASGYNNVLWKIDVDCDKLTTLMKDLFGRQIFTVDQLVLFRILFLLLACC